jgi:hypothetical protein
VPTTLTGSLRRADKVRAWLIEEGLRYWLDGVIPDAAALPFAQILAGQCAEMYGRGPQSDTPYVLADAGLRLLERHVSQRSSKEPVMSEYFLKDRRHVHEYVLR